MKTWGRSLLLTLLATSVIGIFLGGAMYVQYVRHVVISKQFIYNGKKYHVSIRRSDNCIYGSVREGNIFGGDHIQFVLVEDNIVTSCLDRMDIVRAKAGRYVVFIVGTSKYTYDLEQKTMVPDGGAARLLHR